MEIADDGVATDVVAVETFTGFVSDANSTMPVLLAARLTLSPALSLTDDLALTLDGGLLSSSQLRIF